MSEISPPSHQQEEPNNEIGRFLVIRRNGQIARSKLPWNSNTLQMTIGRNQDCDIRVQMQTVSRQQAILKYHPDQMGVVTIMCQGNVNHTKINHVELIRGETKVLPHDSLITVGERSLRFEYDCGYTPNVDVSFWDKFKEGDVPNGVESTSTTNAERAIMTTTDATMDLSKLKFRIQPTKNHSDRIPTPAHAPPTRYSNWRERRQKRANFSDISSNLLSSTEDSNPDNYNEKEEEEEDHLQTILETSMCSQNASFMQVEEGLTDDNGTKIDDDTASSAITQQDSKKNEPIPPYQEEKHIHSSESNNNEMTSNPDRDALLTKTRSNLLQKLRERRLNRENNQDLSTDSNMDIQQEFKAPSSTMSRLQALRERRMRKMHELEESEKLCNLENPSPIQCVFKSQLDISRKRNDKTTIEPKLESTQSLLKNNASMKEQINSNLYKKENTICLQSQTEMMNLHLNLQVESTKTKLQKLQALRERRINNNENRQNESIPKFEDSNIKKSLLQTLRDRREINKNSNLDSSLPKSTLDTEDDYKNHTRRNKPIKVDINAKLLLQEVFTSPTSNDEAFTSNSTTNPNFKYDSVLSPENQDVDTNTPPPRPPLPKVKADLQHNYSTGIGDLEADYLKLFVSDEETNTFLITPTKLLGK